MRYRPAALALLIAFAPLAAAAAPVKLKVGDAAPQFARADFQGQAFDLHALRGKVVLIDFWASWCPPCMIEIPHLIALQKQFGPRGFQVVGVAMDDFAAATRDTMQKIAFNYPVVPGDAKFGNLYGGVLGLPLRYLVGADGKILTIWSGELPPVTLDKGIAAALEKKGQGPVTGKLLAWSWTVVAASAGLIGLFALGQALPGITLILSALAACPPLAAILERRMGAKPALRFGLVVIFAGLAGLGIGQNPAAWKKLRPSAAPAPVLKTLLEASGDFGNMTTKTFAPQGKDWDLQWSFDCSGLGDSGNFTVKVTRKGGGVLASVEKINDRESGAEHYHEAGDFYLQVVSECQWSVKVIG